MTETLLTPDAVAERWQVGREVVMRELRAKRLEHIRIGRKYRVTLGQVEAAERALTQHAADASPVAPTTAAEQWGLRTRGKR